MVRKIRLLLTGSIAPKLIRQLIVIIFPLKDIFKPPPPFFFRKFLISIVFQMPLEFNFFNFWGLQMGHGTFNTAGGGGGMMAV